MKIEVALTAGGVSAELVRNKNAVVIDVLRATSVITTALQNGADEIRTFADADAARQFASSHEAVVLGGERGAVKLAGFDAGNSPLEYKPELVRGKTLALTTTNGTLAIENAKSAAALYIMCFLNVSAVAARLVSDNRDAVIICAGTEGRFSADDSLCAAQCIEYCCRMASGGLPELNDDGRFLRDFYRRSGGDIKALLAECTHVNTLKKLGFAADVDYCLQTDTINAVPRLYNGAIKI